MADPYFYETSLLFPFDGANGSTTFLNYGWPFANVGPQITVVGTASLSTAQSVFGGASLYVDGSGAYLNTDYRSGAVNNLALGLNNWTLRFRARPDDFSGNRFVCGGRLLSTGQETLAVFFATTTGALSFYENGAVRIADAAGSTPGTWYHIELSCTNGVVRLFKEGVPIGTPYSSTVDRTITDLRVGRAYSSSGNFKGYIDEFCLIKGVALHSEAFTPSTSAIDTTALTVPAVTPLISGPGKVVGDAMPSPPTWKLTNTPVSLRDGFYGGTGRVAGTVKEKGTPSNLPLRRRVWLMRERDAVVIRETWSDALTGAYSFDNVDATLKYTVITYDYEHNKRAVIADNITPDPMP